MKRAISIVAVVFAVLTGAEAAFAAHPLLTDDTGTQGKGKLHLEATGAWITDQEHAGGEGVREIGSFAALVFTAGVSETLDLVVGVPYVWTETKDAGQTTKDDGIADTVIEAKLRFYEKKCSAWRSSLEFSFPQARRNTAGEPVTSTIRPS